MPKYQYRELPVDLDKKDNVDIVLAHTLRIPLKAIQNLEIERLSLDSRKRGFPHWSYNVLFETAQALKPQHGLFKKESESKTEPIINSVKVSPVIHVIGAGPAGLWATLHLLRRGFQVKLYEQGKPVEARFRDIRRFFIDRQFNPTSNVLFGEGGAGAFSDGKLNTRTRTIFSQKVLEDMVDFGISKEILYLSKPHIGTNKLVILLRALRKEILNLGGEIFFESKLEDIEIQNHQISKIKINDTWQTCDTLVLAPGHSARDLYELLYEKGVSLEPKGFAMGVRVEHPQTLINERQFGKNVDIQLTGSAEYALTAKTLKATSSAYSFCMCPGGVLVPCASEQGTLATNGMSHSHRKGPFANGAIVVPVQAGNNLWDGLNHQRRLEKAAFEIGENSYRAPAQSIEAFLNNKRDLDDLKKSSYPCGLIPNNLWDWMDSFICESLYEGFLSFERKIPGFIKNGMIIAPETRTSSPLRILRDLDSLESVSTKGLFVLGEGAGYAGGIVTSAADGVRFALKAKKLN